jgi:hypothetical protein
MYQEDWRINNSEEFWPFELVSDYASELRPGEGTHNVSYANILKQICSQKVIKDDVHGVVQLNGDYLSGPPDIDRPERVGASRAGM